MNIRPINTIGIIGALADEVSIFALQLSNRQEQKVGGITFYSGTLYNKDVYICCAGMGKAAAAAATQLLCTCFNCSAIIFSGIAGNMSLKIGVGDVVIGKTVFYHDAEIDMIGKSYPGLSEYYSDKQLVKAAETACRKLCVNYITGRIATGDLFVGDKTVKADIAARCHPDCVEMEGAAVGQIACKNDRPFLILRAMSDNADDLAGQEVRNIDSFNISSYCKTAAELVLHIIENV